MTEEKYIIPANPEYSEKIRKLQDSDPASASTVFNPLFQRLIENTAAVRRMLTADQIIMPDGTTTVSASLSQKVEAEPPEWYDLPLPDGWTGTLRYCKDQIGTVFLAVGCEMTVSPGNTALKLIGTLPVGYRPEYVTNGVGVSTSETAVTIIRVEEDGRIYLFPYVGSTTGWRGTRGTVVFPANS